MTSKKRWVTAIIIAFIFILAIWTFVIHSKSTKSEKIILGSQGTDTLVWQHIAKSEEAKKEHLDISVKDFTSGNDMNTALANNDIQANAFQVYTFYTNYNKNNPKNKLYALGTTYIQPMGIYSSRYKKLSDIPNNSVVVIATEPAPQSRGLKLLETAGLIQLKKHSSSDLLTPNDITKNEKNIQIKTVTLTATASLLHDKGVAAVVIDNNTAQMAKLNVFKDALFHEKVEKNPKENVNINVIVTNKEHKDDPNYQKLVKLYHNKNIQEWIQKNFPGKVEIKKSISDLEKM